MLVCLAVFQSADALRTVSEEATPDCDLSPPELYPARQRMLHLSQLGVDRWHAAGWRGQGVKIAILDTGFRGYRNHLGNALPAHVTTKSFRSDGNLQARDSQHGILCAEVLHALAPEAELLLANWDTDAPAQFVEAARWARQSGARIISCSIIMPSWSDGEGGGYVNGELARIVGSGHDRQDMLYFASAGNTAQRHWCGSFRDNGSGYHEWKTARTSNRLAPWGSDRVSVELYWKPGPDFELLVTDRKGRPVGSAQAHRGSDRFCTVIQFMPQEDERYQVQVRRKEGTPGSFHLAVLGGGLAYSTAKGSIPCPADCPAVLAVGAVEGDGHRAGYSSCGPNSQRPKPDFMAPVPFPSLWRERPFTGTSAAAPQAAGLAALYWCRSLDSTPRQIRRAMREAARDLGPTGHDCETGYGIIHLPEIE